MRRAARPRSKGRRRRAPGPPGATSGGAKSPSTPAAPWTSATINERVAQVVSGDDVEVLVAVLHGAGTGDVDHPHADTGGLTQDHLVDAAGVLRRDGER